MSDTPRTDAELQKNEGGSISFIFARQLERELTAALSERDAAQECLREAMKWILDNPYIDGLKKKWRAAAGLEQK